MFLPFKEGNKQINLNQIALSKIQSFHSTFGEDNQIYSQEEIIDRNLSKLFEEGVNEQKKDINKELPFYEELRTLFKTNRQEYNRMLRYPYAVEQGESLKLLMVLRYLKTHWYS